MPCTTTLTNFITNTTFITETNYIELTNILDSIDIVNIPVSNWDKVSVIATIIIPIILTIWGVMSEYRKSKREKKQTTLIILNNYIDKYINPQVKELYMLYSKRSRGLINQYSDDDLIILLRTTELRMASYLQIIVFTEFNYITRSIKTVHGLTYNKVLQDSKDRIIEVLIIWLDYLVKFPVHLLQDQKTYEKEMIKWFEKIDKENPFIQEIYGKTFQKLYEEKK